MNRRWKNPSTTTKATYATWAAMNRRCYNPADADYARYGGRGITVCDRWRHNYDAFYEDMGARPAGLTLERVNGVENYTLENCVWATRLEQAQNTRTCRGGAAMARRIGVTRQSALYRLDRGISEKVAKRPNEAEHGTVSRYTSAKHKCRCGNCTEAWRVYQTNRRKTG